MTGVQTCALPIYPQKTSSGRKKGQGLTFSVRFFDCECTSLLLAKSKVLSDCQKSNHLTDLGIKVVTFFTKLYHRLFAPGLAALLPDQLFPSDLAKALNQVAAVLHNWSNDAFLVPVLTYL